MGLFKFLSFFSLRYVYSKSTTHLPRIPSCLSIDTSSRAPATLIPLLKHLFKYLLIICLEPLCMCWITMNYSTHDTDTMMFVECTSNTCYKIYYLISIHSMYIYSISISAWIGRNTGFIWSTLYETQWVNIIILVPLLYLLISPVVFNHRRELNLYDYDKPLFRDRKLNLHSTSSRVPVVIVENFG